MTVVLTDEHAHDLCICGHEAHLHGREADGTRGICIRDEWCECPGYHPNADYEPPEPDGECYRGNEYASALAEEQARIQRELK